MSLSAMRTPWLRPDCWASLLCVRMIPRHLFLSHIKKFCLQCDGSAVCCLLTQLMLVFKIVCEPPCEPCGGHFRSLWVLQLLEDVFRIKSKVSFEKIGFQEKRLSLSLSSLSLSLSPRRLLAQWVASRNWVSAPTQPALPRGGHPTTNPRTRKFQNSKIPKWVTLHPTSYIALRT